MESKLYVISMILGYCVVVSRLSTWYIIFYQKSSVERLTNNYIIGSRCSQMYLFFGVLFCGNPPKKYFYSKCIHCFLLAHYKYQVTKGMRYQYSMCCLICLSLLYHVSQPIILIQLEFSVFIIDSDFIFEMLFNVSSRAFSFQY